MTQRPTQIAPSILSTDFAALGVAARQMQGVADMLHVDVMDGHFVPNLTIGPPVVASLNNATDLFLDCHLMMTNPLDYVDAFVAAGADRLTVHIEVVGTSEFEARDAFKQIRDAGAQVGLTLNPGTDIETILPYVADVDLILIMTVQPGFGGQSFRRDCVPKIARVRAEIDQLRVDTWLQVDGGINLDTGRIAVDAGAEILVAGNAIFGSDDPVAAARALKSILPADGAKTTKK
jgi:ribulose-phosphate 3-epimerase